MGMFGWDDPKQAAIYTRKAKQEAGASRHAPHAGGVEEEKKLAECPTASKKA